MSTLTFFKEKIDDQEIVLVNIPSLGEVLVDRLSTKNKVDAVIQKTLSGSFESTSFGDIITKIDIYGKILNGCGIDEDIAENQKKLMTFYNNHKVGKDITFNIIQNSTTYGHCMTVSLDTHTISDDQFGKYVQFHLAIVGVEV